MPGVLGETCNPDLGDLACLDPPAECVNVTDVFICHCEIGYVEDSGTCSEFLESHYFLWYDLKLDYTKNFFICLRCKSFL